jgi:hypothetical protein
MIAIKVFRTWVHRNAAPIAHFLGIDPCLKMLQVQPPAAKRCTQVPL